MNCSKEAKDRLSQIGDADRPGHQTLYREATLESEPEIGSEGGDEKGCEEVKEEKGGRFVCC